MFVFRIFWQIPAKTGSKPLINKGFQKERVKIKNARKGHCHNKFLISFGSLYREVKIKKSVKGIQVMELDNRNERQYI